MRFGSIRYLTTWRYAAATSAIGCCACAVLELQAELSCQCGVLHHLSEMWGLATLGLSSKDDLVENESEERQRADTARSACLRARRCAETAPPLFAARGRSL
jgi:hypothetical protein